MRAVTVEPVVQQFCGRLNWPTGMNVDGVVSGKHGLSAEAGAGAVVIETSVQQFGLGSKGEVRGRHCKCFRVGVGFKGGYDMC